MSFSAQGDPEWCEKQLSAVLAAASGLLTDAPREAPGRVEAPLPEVTMPDFDAAPDDPEPEPLSTPDVEFQPGPPVTPAPARASNTPSDFSVTLTNYLKARAGSNQRLHTSDGRLRRVRA